MMIIEPGIRPTIRRSVDRDARQTRTKLLRVALVAGTLGRGGAEKQLVYMARALANAGVDVRVFCPTRNECHEAALEAQGQRPVWFGRFGHPVPRALTLSMKVLGFRPHIIQSIHYFTNFYSYIASKPARAEAIGGVRNDLLHELESVGCLGRPLLEVPPSVIANTHAARENARRLGLKNDHIYYLGNVIDLEAFDREAARSVESGMPESGRPLAMAVGRLVRPKRFDRFIEALALARASIPALAGAIVGDGPERERLAAQAARHGLGPADLIFFGARDDIPALLRRADLLALTSDHEGFPNVLMEAMAARRPVVTTPAGDAAQLVEEGASGFLVAFDDVAALSERLVRLASDPGLRHTMGQLGRRRVEQDFGSDQLARNLLAIYRAIADRRRNARLRDVLRLYPG